MVGPVWDPKDRFVKSCLRSRADLDFFIISGDLGRLVLGSRVVEPQ